MAASFYETLGVPKDATADQIRSAYRKLARQYHPDVNPNDKAAETKFKDISAAYEVLSDDKRRAAYDEFGAESLQGGFDPAKAREYARWKDTRQRRASTFEQDGPIEFDFSELFGRARGPRRGPDLQAVAEMDLRQALGGSEVTLDIPGQGVVRVRIPPGAATGDIVRIAGKGGPGAQGGAPGDLIIEAVVRPHPLVRRDGLNLQLALPVTLDEAYNGASVDVPTFDGPVALKIPARSQNHARLRLRGKGVARGGKRGDLIVELDVRMPDQANEALAECLRASHASYGRPVREELKL